MAIIDKRTRTLFFTTSPRTPQKMIPEIKLLVEKFDGCKWSGNAQLQCEYMESLVEMDFFNGKTPKDPAFSARDRITRGPKSLGFVDLSPKVSLTPAGQAFVYGGMSDEALLRQLLKFQLPSPYHKANDKSNTTFFVKPYLEMIRLVRHFGSLSFEELKLFGLQMTEFSRFDEIVEKIEEFRIEKARHKGSYKKFIAQETAKVICEIYTSDINEGDTSTRESQDASLAKFIKTKSSNLRDYADACFRYLRATGIVNLSQSGHSLSIAPDRIEDVDYILQNVDPRPSFVDDEAAYKEYLFDSQIPALLSDNPSVISSKLAALGYKGNIGSLSIPEAKSLERKLRNDRKEALLEEEIHRIKDCELYDDIQSVFDGIENKDYYDNPLMFEWNSWRAMTMIDGGNIVGNFNVDDDGKPLSTAAGNASDIVCSYDTFDLTVEVTLQSGQRQYNNEAEPVARHLGRRKEETGRETFCLFIAPKINDATIAHFYMLHKVNIALYGGNANIIPMELSTYRKMLSDSYKASYTPKPSQIRNLFMKSEEYARNATNEIDWFNNVTNYALNWLN